VEPACWRNVLERFVIYKKSFHLSLFFFCSSGLVPMIARYKNMKSANIEASDIKPVSIFPVLLNLFCIATESQIAVTVLYFEF